MCLNGQLWGLQHFWNWVTIVDVCNIHCKHLVVTLYKNLCPRKVLCIFLYHVYPKISFSSQDCHVLKASQHATESKDCCNFGVLPYTGFNIGPPLNVQVIFHDLGCSWFNHQFVHCGCHTAVSWKPSGLQVAHYKKMSILFIIFVRWL